MIFTFEGRDFQHLLCMRVSCRGFCDLDGFIPGGNKQPLPLDDLLRIGSVLGGRESPQWPPNGKALLFSSGFNGGELISVGIDGYFPLRIPIDLGEPGHFLSSHLVRLSPDRAWISYISTKSGSPSCGCGRLKTAEI